MINNHSVKYLSIIIILYTLYQTILSIEGWLAGHVGVPVPSFNIISTIQSDDKQRDLCEDYRVLVTGDWRTGARADISGDLPGRGTFCCSLVTSSHHTPQHVEVK